MNYQGETIVVSSYVYPERIYSTRRTTLLQKRLLREGLLKRTRIGRGELKLVGTADAIRCTYSMLDEKVEFYPERKDAR